MQQCSTSEGHSPSPRAARGLQVYGFGGTCQLSSGELHAAAAAAPRGLCRGFGYLGLTA